MTTPSAKPSLLKRILFSRPLAVVLLLASTAAVLVGAGGYCHVAELLRIEELPHSLGRHSLESIRKGKTISLIMLSSALSVLALACSSLVLGGRCRSAMRQACKLAGPGPSAAEAEATTDAPAESKPGPSKSLSWLGLGLLFVGLVVAATGAGGAVEYADRMKKSSCEKVRKSIERHGKPAIVDLSYTGQDDLSFTYAGMLEDERGRISSLKEADALWDSLGRKHKANGGRNLALQMTAQAARSSEAWGYGAGRSSSRKGAKTDFSLQGLDFQMERIQLADVLAGAFRQDQYRPGYTMFLAIAIAGGVDILAAFVVLFLRRARRRS